MDIQNINFDWTFVFGGFAIHIFKPIKTNPLFPYILPILFLLPHLFPTCLLPLGAAIPLVGGRRGKIEWQRDRKEEMAIYGNIHHMCAYVKHVCVHVCRPQCACLCLFSAVVIKMSSCNLVQANNVCESACLWSSVWLLPGTHYYNTQGTAQLASLPPSKVCEQGNGEGEGARLI